MIDNEILDDYSSEAKELLDEMDTSLIRLETEGGSSELLNNIFRAAHCIKGSAEYIGLERSSTLTHGVENLLDRLREGVIELSDQIVNFLFRAKDRIALLTEEVSQDREEKSDIASLMEELHGFLGESMAPPQIITPQDVIEEAVFGEVQEDFEFSDVEESSEEHIPELTTELSYPESDVETDYTVADVEVSEVVEPTADITAEEAEPPSEVRAEISESHEQVDEEKTALFESPTDETAQPEVTTPTGQLDAGTTLEETIPHLLNLSLYLDDLHDGLESEEVFPSFFETLGRLTRSMEFLELTEAADILRALHSRLNKLDVTNQELTAGIITELRAMLQDLRPFYPPESFPWPEGEIEQTPEPPSAPPETLGFSDDLAGIEGLEPAHFQLICDAGYSSMEELSVADAEALQSIPGLSYSETDAILRHFDVSEAEGKIIPHTAKPGERSLLADVDDELLDEFESIFEREEAAARVRLAAEQTQTVPSGPYEELLTDLETLGEDADREIMEIFLSYGWEITDKIGPIVERIQQGASEPDDLKICADYVKSIRSSSTYMDFKNLAAFLDDWFERSLWAAERADSLSTGELSFVFDSLALFKQFLKALETTLKPGIAAKPAVRTPPPREPLPAAPDFVEPIEPIQRVSQAAEPEAARRMPQPQASRTVEKPVVPQPSAPAAAEQPVSEAAMATPPTVPPDLEGLPAPRLEEEETVPGKEPTQESPVVRTMRVDSAKVDLLLNQVGELVVNRSYVEQLSMELKNFQREIMIAADVGKRDLQSIKDITLKLGEASISLGRVATDIQEGVMKLRMLPVGQLFNRMPRLIRDLSRRVGKSVDLQVQGGDTEVDKRVIEQVYNPLVHLIRNAVDHGIEDTTTRTKRGKREQGSILLNAYSQGNHVVIDVEDDGGGIDTEVVRKKAIESRLLDPADVPALTDQETYGFLFVPGFSTSTAVTRTSGRGVGMDVVKKDIEKINGQVELESQKGRGTKISIKIPLTLAIIQALLIRFSKHVFAIPLASVREIIQVTPEEITTIEGYEVIKFRQETIPILRVNEVFNFEEYDPSEEPGFLVLATAGNKSVGILVEELIGEQDVVIKPLAEHVFRSKGLAGSTILGDGTISLVLDISEIVDEVIFQMRKTAAQRPTYGDTRHQNGFNPSLEM
jgi:two-component system, chemotaxis family, sensor kinase CheA